MKYIMLHMETEYVEVISKGRCPKVWIDALASQFPNADCIIFDNAESGDSDVASVHYTKPDGGCRIQGFSWNGLQCEEMTPTGDILADLLHLKYLTTMCSIAHEYL